MSGPFGAGGLGFFGTAEFYDYLLKRSLRFNNDGSTGATGTTSRLKFTPDSAGTSNTDWTVSFWIKRNLLSTTQDIIDVGAGDGTGGSGSSDSNTDSIQFQSDDTIRIQNNGSAILHTNSLFRDTSAWYNIVVKSDADNGTAADKLKVYINGVDQDDSAAGGGGFSTDNRSGLSSWAEFGSTDPIQIGARIYNNANNLDAYLAEFHYVDGTALTASSFGETKEGIWISKQYTGSHGTNGFYLNFTDDNSAAGFSSVAYTGPIPKASPQDTTGEVTGVGFQPDFVWIKNRTNGNNHQLYDVVRGITSSGTQVIHTSSPNAESTSNNNGGVSAITVDGFTVKAGTDGGSDPSNTTRANLVGGDNHNYVAWNWQAGGAPTTDNSAGAGNVPTAGSVKIDGSNSGSALAGTIPATRLSANTTYGFSIVTYTGTGVNGATVAHGLGSAPTMIFIKSRSATSADGNWVVYAKAGTVDETDYQLLNSTVEATDAVGAFNDTATTSDVFSLGTFDDVNESTKTYVAYCWVDVSGYSKIGGYTGNGSTGQTITTGFKVGWLMVKRTDVANSWYIVDNTRSPNTAAGNDDLLYANLTSIEGSTNDFLSLTSTGFTLNSDSPAVNTSTGEYIYMAFKDTRTNAYYLDQSGNANNFAATGLEYKDSRPDSPTNNSATFNALVKDLRYATALSDGNKTITFTSGSSGFSGCPMTIFRNEGKAYCEVNLDVTYSGDSTDSQCVFVVDDGQDFSAIGSGSQNSALVGSYCGGGSGSAPAEISSNGSDQGGSPSKYRTQNDRVGVYIDFDGDGTNGKGFFALNGTVQTVNGTPDIANGTNPHFTFTANSRLTVGVGGIHAGTPAVLTLKDDSSDWETTPPSGYTSFSTANLQDPAIDPNKGDDPKEYFNTVLYIGDGSSNRGITGVGFSPDFLWIKDRVATNNHILVDKVRGVAKLLFSNSNIAEISGATQIASLDADGFTLGTSTTYVNENGSSNAYVAWNWKAGGSTQTTNTDGTITSLVSVSAESGFSVVAYTGTGSAGTVGHGLGKAPAWIIIKNRGTGNREWLIYHHESEGVPQNFGMFFTNADPFDDDSAFNDTAPTTDVFSVKNSTSSNNTSEEYIAYCFAEIEGYSRFGRFAAVGGADNSFIYLGFRPAWFLIKRVNADGYDWVLYDNTRDPFNVGSTRVSPNLSNAEVTGASNYGIDFVSNGVKLRSGQADTATDGGTYIYMAFAEQPFKYANAR